MSCAPLKREEARPLPGTTSERVGERGLLLNSVEKMMSHMFSERSRVFVAAISLLAGGGLLGVGAGPGQGGDPGETRPAGGPSEGPPSNPPAGLPGGQRFDFTLAFLA